MEETNEKKVVFSLSRIVALIVFGSVILIAIIQAFLGNTKSPFTIDGALLWLGAFLTLCILSFLYDDNPFYRFAEHLYVGIATAYFMVVGFWSTLVPNLFGKLSPEITGNIIDGLKSLDAEYIFIIPFILGIMLLLRLSKRLGWVSRMPIAFIVGATCGLNFVRYFQSDFMLQIQSSMDTLIVLDNGEFTWAAFQQTFSHMIVIVGVITALMYFFFSKEHKGWFGHASKFGIWILMLAFGAAFGYTVMGRIALLVGRIEFLFRDWLGLVFT